MDFFTFFIIQVISIVKWAILIRILLSWVKVNRSNRIVIFIYQLTEPVLGIFRRILPRTGMIDLSPLLAFFALDFLQIFLLGFLGGI